MKVGARAELPPIHRSTEIAGIASAGTGLAAVDRHGRLVLLAVFTALLGGRFTLDRLGEHFTPLDFRWPALLAILTMAFLWFAASSYKSSQQLTPGSGLLFFVGWAAWMTCSAVWAQPGARVESYVSDFLLMVTFIVLTATIVGRLSRRALRAVWWWIAITGMVYFAAAVYAGPGLQGRYSAFGGGPNVFVRVMVLACFGAFFLATVRNSRWILLTVPIFLSGAVLSGSRGGLVAFLVVIVLGSIPQWRRMPSRVRRTVATLALAITLVVPVAIGLPFADELRGRLIVQTLQQEYDSDRGEIAETALQLFESHPIVGTGLDGYFALTGGAFSYPHNLALATAAEGGTIGVILLVVALGQFIRTIFACRPLATETLYALLGAIYILVASMFSGDYYDSRLLWFFLVLAAVESRRAGQALP